MPDTTSRLVKAIEARDLTVTAIERMIGVGKGTLTKALKKKKEWSLKHINMIFDVLPGMHKDEVSYIMTGETPKPIDLRKLQEITEPPEGDLSKEIPFINEEVFATISPAMSDSVTLKPDTFIRIPMFNQGEYAVQVTGNSMKGVINNGDWVVIKRINNPNFIIYGEAYLVVTRTDNLKTVKYVKEDPHDENALWLSPYNIEQFEGQSIPKEEILEMYKVIGLFRRM